MLHTAVAATFIVWRKYSFLKNGELLGQGRSSQGRVPCLDWFGHYTRHDNGFIVNKRWMYRISFKYI